MSTVPESERPGWLPSKEAITRAAARGARYDAWHSRYTSRGPMLAEPIAASLLRDQDGEAATWDPAGPYAGVDGARYRPGGLHLSHGTEPALIAEGRGRTELVTGWESFGAMRDWIAQRGTGGSRELTPPPVPGPTRTWLEDTVLAHLVNRPYDAPGVFQALPPDTMTTDVRWDLFDAARRLSGDHGSYFSPEALVADAVSRLDSVPSRELFRYGGTDGLFTRLYVHRLAETSVSRDEFREAIAALRREDRQLRLPSVPTVVPSQSAERAAPQANDALMTETPETCPDFPAGHVSGPLSGPRPGPPAQGR